MKTKYYVSVGCVYAEKPTITHIQMEDVFDTYDELYEAYTKLSFRSPESFFVNEPKSDMVKIELLKCENEDAEIKAFHRITDNDVCFVNPIFIENFNVGDKVYTNNWDEGIIIEILDNGNVLVEFTANIAEFSLNELKLKYIPKKKSTLYVYERSSFHRVVDVMIQNCSTEVVNILQKFDIDQSAGRIEYDENKPDEEPKIWFTCPSKFSDFVESRIGDTFFKRMGVDEITILCGGIF